MAGQGPTAIWRCPGSTASAEELSASDFVTFRSLDTCPIAMTAHVVYDSIDPQRPATTSPKVIRDVIRGEIGFDGLLMSDDLSMQALDGPLAVRAQAGPVRGLRRGAPLQWRYGRDEGSGGGSERVGRAHRSSAANHALVASCRVPDAELRPRRRGSAAGRACWERRHDRRRRKISTISKSTAIVADDEALVVTVDGFEGPLDLLLTLARNQKVDIAKISILKLADQYLEFIEAAKRINLELAADYLVMAAWLAYLKSRLVLPQEKGPDGEPTADEMATRLRWRLQRLDAMRAAATRLMGRERLDRDVFGRGDPEPVNVIKLRTYKDTLYDLLTAYATDRARRLGGKAYQPADGPGAPDRGGAGAAGADAGQDLRLERADPAPAPGMAGRARGGARPWPRPCWPAWSWPATASWNSSRWRRSRKFMCATGHGGPYATGTGSGEHDMSSVAKMIATIETEMDAEAREPVSQRQSRASAGWSRRCCSPPANRWTKRRCQHRLPEGADVPGLLADASRDL